MVEHGFLSRRTGGVDLTRRRIGLMGVALLMLALMVLLTSPVVDVSAGKQSSVVNLVAQSESGEPSSTGTLSVADVAELANAAVVTVYTFIEGDSIKDGIDPVNPNDDSRPGGSTSDEPTPLGAGSGWIYSEDGYVVTNAHVVLGADSYVVQYADGTQVVADLVGVDSFQDVAVLRLELEEGEAVPGVATVGDSSGVRAGDEVVAIGSPLGEFANTVSDGTIGGLDRSLDVGNGVSLDNLIQHDAEISPGNSGGPLLNMHGEVIGMNVAKLDPAATGGPSLTGLNFAIDGNTVAGIVEEIIRDGGSVEHPYLGVQTQFTNAGLVVVALEPGGPAAEAGIEEGDLLIGIDGVQVDQDHSFMQLLLEQDAGETIPVTVQRNGSTQDVSVTLGVRPDSV